MTTLLPVLTLLVGFFLNELAQLWREKRASKDKLRERRDEFLANTLTEALLVIDKAYETASAIGLNADTHAVQGQDSQEKWEQRAPLVNACGAASFHVRRVAALFPAGESPRLELEQVAQSTADMTGVGTTKQLIARWHAVEPTVIAARESVALQPAGAVSDYSCD